MAAVKFRVGAFSGTWARRLAAPVALCAAPVALEALVVYFLAGLRTSVNIAPQASALWPYGSFHDLRWVLVYHRSWWQFAVFTVAAIVLRGVFCAVVIRVCWPPEVPDPGLPQLVRRNLIAAALFTGALTPPAALSIVLSDVSLGVFLVGEVATLLIIAPFLQRAGMVPGWWRHWPPAATVGISLLSFATLTGGGGLVAIAPGGLRFAIAALFGGLNGLLWRWAVGTAVRHTTVRPARVPAGPIAYAAVVCVIFAVGAISQRAVDLTYQGEPPALAHVEALASRHPVIFVAGYNTAYHGESAGFTPPIIRYSYTGLDARGHPRPYQPVDTHQSLVTSAGLLNEQITQIHRETGQPVSVLAESEGALITKYYLMTTPHTDVEMVALLSPLLRAGRVYYPPRDAHTGWGIATGWQLRGMLWALDLTGGLPNSPDEPFLRSLLDNAPLFRGKQLLCPTAGVETIALLPIFDASANPPGLHPEIEVVEIPARHGLLIDNPAARRRVIDFFKAGRKTTKRRTDYSLLQYLGVAWQTPALKIQLNPVWDTVAGVSTRHQSPQRCLPR